MRILFPTFLLVYLGVSFLVIFHMMDVLKPFKFRYVLLVVYIVFSLAMILGRGLSSFIPLELGAMISRLGYIWVGLLTFSLVWSLTFILLRHFQIGPVADRSRLILFGVELILCALLLMIGYKNSYDVKVVQHTISNDKGINLRAVQITDVHLGYMNSEKQFSKIVDQINSLNPDIVFITGDFLENENSYAVKKNIGASINRLNPKLGIWAVNGNHEYIAGIKESEDYIKHLGIKMLSDTTTFVNDDILLIGREDPAKTWRTNKPPLPFEQILAQKINNELSVKDVIPEKLTILLVHQVKNHAIYENMDIDLVISGHTHAGQFFPWTLVVKKVYDIPYGLVKRGKSYFYVSGGAGVWGPAMRLGTKSEIVLFEMESE